MGTTNGTRECATQSVSACECECECACICLRLLLTAAMLMSVQHRLNSDTDAMAVLQIQDVFDEPHDADDEL
jgi:hypothetical protein